MPVRELRHPSWVTEPNDEGIALRFWIPNSMFGAVEIVLSLEQFALLAYSVNESSLAAELGQDGQGQGTGDGSAVEVEVSEL